MVRRNLGLPHRLISKNFNCVIWVKSKIKQSVIIDGIEFYFEKDELIHTEVSRKYDDQVLKQILSKTDIRWENKITDSKQFFANYVLEKN